MACRAALFALSLCIISTAAVDNPEIQSREFYPRDLDYYYPSQYIARSGHSTIVVGNYLYLDGGEIYINEGGAVAVYPENSTYSFDLTFSWTNNSNSLPWYQIYKGYVPLVDGPTLWKDGSNNSFYSYDGFLVANSGQSTPSNQLWQFIPDGAYDGSWNLSDILSSSIFSSLQRTQGQASTYGNGVGYALGGMDSYNIPIPGLVSYNTTSGLWANMSTNGFTDSGTSMFGQLHFVPGFGSAGLLVALGGQTSDRTQWVPSNNFVSLQSINIFDPVTGIWANQMTSGTIPPPRANFCSVGVQGDNGTFEIFIYGGRPQGDPSGPPSHAELQAAFDLDAVYVLSLPAFNWQQAAFTPRRSRAWHTCDVIGNRQMVVVGGKQPFVHDRRQTPDFLSQGFGIFDLNAMEWTSMYNAAAAPYITPSVVKSWYDEHGRYPPSWSNDTVAAWFGDPPAKQRFSKTGIIVGAAVGLVALLLLIGAVTWICLRRRSKKPEGRFALRRRSNKLEGPPNAYHDEAELDARGTAAPPYKNHGPELDSTGTVKYPYQTNVAEFDARPHPKEKGSWQVHEVPSSPKYELP